MAQQPHYQGGQPHPYTTQQAYPPQRLPKKPRRWPWVLLALFVGFIVVVVFISAVSSSDSFKEGFEDGYSADTNSNTEPQAPAANDEQGAPGKGIQYVIETSDGTPVDLTFSVEGDQTRQLQNVPTPWTSDTINPDDLMLAQVMAQNTGGGRVTCKIVVDGKVESTNYSEGDYAIADCTGEVNLW